MRRVDLIDTGTREHIDGTAESFVRIKRIDHMSGIGIDADSRNVALTRDGCRLAQNSVSHSNETKYCDYPARVESHARSKPPLRMTGTTLTFPAPPSAKRLNSGRDK